MDADRDRWDARHAAVAPAEPRPPDALVAARLADHVPTRGRLLDVACGLGAVSRWAARRGLRVVALDVSGVAIDHLSSSAEARAGRIDARRVDLDDGLPGDVGLVDVAVCQRFRDERVLGSLPDVVAPGGLLVVTLLSEVGADDPGPFHAPAGDLLERLPADDPGWDRLHHAEADGESSIVLRRRPSIDGEPGGAR